MHNGRPLDGANVRFVPETFLGPNIPTATGVTDQNGVAMLSIPTGGVGGPPGVPPGFFRVEITKRGPKIPAKYNKETIFGQEVAIDTPTIRTGIKFDLEFDEGSRVRDTMRGFTLVELLVVVTIIGILIALLVPAVQSAREAARIAQCQNNIKQLALGCLDHENATRRFPTGGWGFAWTGDPDRGNDWRQPGGWIFNVLPYIEQQALHDLGMGAAPGSAAKLDSGSLRVGMPLTCIDCPSRRRAIVYPWGHAAAWWTFATNMNPPSLELLTSRNDYALCGGEFWTYAAWPHAVQNAYAGPSPALSPNGGYLYVDNPQWSDRWAVATTSQLSPYWPPGVPGPAKADGVSFAMSMIGPKDVTDGLSNTYLLGEKNMDPDHYTDSNQAGDSTFALQGFDFGTYRFANDYGDCPDCTVYDVAGPHPDTPGYEYPLSFGGPHLLGFNMALCDGSVRMVNYSIDLTTHSRLSDRCDGEAIDPKKAFYPAKAPAALELTP